MTLTELHIDQLTERVKRLEATIVELQKKLDEHAHEDPLSAAERAAISLNMPIGGYI